MGKIYRSRCVFTSDSDTPIDGFIVVEGNKIIAVEEISNLDNYSTHEMNDYGDCTIIPSFHDSHTHVIIGALMEEGGFLRYAKSEEEAAKTIFEKHKNSEEKWILGGAWDHFQWPTKELPKKETLDKYFSKPVFLVNRECHGAWANSAALRELGINSETPDPPYGKIHKDEKGEPTGYLHETAYASVMGDVMSSVSSELLQGYAKKFFKKAHTYGVTAVSDMQIAGISLYDIYDAMEQKDELTCRVHYCPPLDFPIEKMVELKERHNSEWLRFSGAKDFVDGTPMGYTGLMVDEYSDTPGFFGSPLIDIDEMKHKVLELDKVGIRSRLHACGDMAVRASLDAFENAIRTNNSRDVRHTVEHIEVCTPEDIPRFGELGVIAAVQPEHLPKYDFYNHAFHNILGLERIRYSWPFKSIYEKGGLLGFGTDYPVSELDPFRGLFRAVTRLTDELEPEGGFIPEEKLSLADSIKAYTYGSAYINYREDDLGILAPGKLADIAILDRNIFEIDPKELKEVSVVATIMDGQCVYEK